MCRQILLPLSLPLCLAGWSAAADPLAETCRQIASDAVCACASDTLTSQLSDVDFAFYAMTAGQAAKLQTGGASLAEAWDTATEGTAAVAGISYSVAMKRLNTAGAAHREAITACQS